MNPEWNRFAGESEKMYYQRMSIPSGSGGSKPPKKEKKRLFDNIEYKHTAQIPADAWFLRFWAWMWETDVGNADFCKLFWGYVFCPLNLFMRTILIPVFLLVLGVKKSKNGIEGWHHRRITNRPTPTKEQRQQERDKEVISKAKAQRREERVMAFFRVVSTVADRIVGAAKRCWPVARIVLFAIGGILAVGIAAGLGWAVYSLVALIVANALAVGKVTLTILGITLGIATLVGTAIGIGYLLFETKPGEAVLRFLDRVFGAFLRAMYIGLCGVKSRTCPKIELIKD